MSPTLSVSLFNHNTDHYYDRLVADQVLERARGLARLAGAKGLAALDATDPLVRIGCEIDHSGRVTKNSFGLLDLSWQAAEHPEWPGVIRQEIDAIRASIREAQGVELRNLIWAGMGGSAEDKAMYSALGLLDGGVRVYILDSTDPAKLQAILAAMTRDRIELERALQETLVVAMAMGMTSYEPLLNLEKLHLLYQKHGVARPANFLYMTLPRSLLDRFAAKKRFRRVELQLDNDNTTAGRHSGPLTRGSLYPLAFNGTDLNAWMQATVLSEDEIREAFRMAAFLHGCGVEGRDKVRLLLPREWKGAGIWTKQDFEESLGKSEELGIKIFPDTSARGRKNVSDRVLWLLEVEGYRNADARPDGPTAVLRLRGEMVLAKYMQWVHYVVFGMGWLRHMNFVTQPSVELYKEIANRLHRDAQKAGKIERAREWRALTGSRYRARAPGGITLYYDSLIGAGLIEPEEPRARSAAEVFAGVLQRLLAEKRIEYAELTFYGDTRYRPDGRRLREVLHSAAKSFDRRLGILTDVYEGPAMNHSYHEMIIGHGRCFSTVILTRQQAALRAVNYRAEYHKAQWLATKLALERRGRAVVGLVLPDLSPGSRRALQAFFQRVSEQLGRE